MSTYNKITRHPRTIKYMLATWHDDYFGPHLYGVEFPEDKVVYPAKQVEEAQLETFWVADVMEGMRKFAQTEFPTVDSEVIVLALLEQIDKACRERWERDPIEGEGAVQW